MFLDELFEVSHCLHCLTVGAAPLHYLKLKVVFFFSLKNFNRFSRNFVFRSSTSNCYISERFALRGLGEVSTYPKFYLISGFVHNSVPQRWDLFRFGYTFACKKCGSKLNVSKKWEIRREFWKMLAPPYVFSGFLRLVSYSSVAVIRWYTSKKFPGK